MRGRPAYGRPTLTHSIDKEIYQIVCKIADEQEQSLEKPSRLSVPFVYDRIKRSNSSLSRRSKKLLEDSIERVLEVLKDDADSSDDLGSIEGEFDGIEVSAPRSVNVVNKSIVGIWAKTDSQSNASETPINTKTRVQEPVKTKKRAVDGEHPAKRRKANAEPDRSAPTHVSLDDLGGVDDIMAALEELICLPLLHPGVFTATKLQPERGILLHGPPGCGKSMIANAFAAELEVPFISIAAPSIVSGMSGESEKALREHFEEAKKLAPCIVFIDEIDAITPKRESAQREMEKRIVAQLLTCMDDLALGKTGGKPVIVLAATNRPDSLDPALRRAGRFGKEINMSVPNETARELILKALTRQLGLAEGIDFGQLAKATPGFVGADLNDLVSTAGSAALRRLVNEMRAAVPSMNIDTEDNSKDNSKKSPRVQKLRQLISEIKRHATLDDAQPSIRITHSDFLTALPKIQPSSKREGFATIPDTTWTDIGALQSLQSALKKAIVSPILHPEKYARVGITTPNGVLLWGPPGCGKTLLAKAVANESRANFISVKGPELLNKYVGESERAVRQVFVRARSSVPCVIFFDELDALVPKRNDALSESSARVVNMLLTELDGLDSGGAGRQGIYVIGATNRPDIIDAAMLRPGRLEKLLYVGLPGEEERVEILRTLVRKLDIRMDRRQDAEVAEEEKVVSTSLALLARGCEGFSGADLGSLVREAGNVAIERDAERLETQDFWSARRLVKPSVRDLGRYERLREKWEADGRDQH